MKSYLILNFSENNLRILVGVICSDEVDTEKLDVYDLKRQAYTSVRSLEKNPKCNFHTVFGGKDFYLNKINEIFGTDFEKMQIVENLEG